jgi:hypothetical protein
VRRLSGHSTAKIAAAVINAKTSQSVIAREPTPAYSPWAMMAWRGNWSIALNAHRAAYFDIDMSSSIGVRFGRLE